MVETSPETVFATTLLRCLSRLREWEGTFKFIGLILGDYAAVSFPPLLALNCDNPLLPSLVAFPAFWYFLARSPSTLAWRQQNGTHNGRLAKCQQHETLRHGSRRGVNIFTHEATKKGGVLAQTHTHTRRVQHCVHFWASFLNVPVLLRFRPLPCKLCMWCGSRPPISPKLTY